MPIVFTHYPNSYEEQVENYSYLGGLFTGVLKDDKPLNGWVKNITLSYKTSFNGFVKDGAICDEVHVRFQRKNTTTPFQQLLNAVDEPDDQTRKIILYGYQNYKNLTREEKYDITNDNVRRIFESYFAKNLLTNVMKVNYTKIQELSNKLLEIQSEILQKNNLFLDWQSACNGTYKGKDLRLQQLVTRICYAKEAISTLDLNELQKTILFDLYARRYLTYLIRDTDVYRSDHPFGVLKASSSPFYFKRGRLDGGFRININSKCMGIIRSIDKSPMDLQVSTIPEKEQGIEPSLYTRCPDRLNMADPDSIIDKDPDSWLTHNFIHRVMPFVNGLSGSILIEIQSLLFIKNIIKKNSSRDFLNSIETLIDYFKSIAGIYVLIDGGHSLFEIYSSFNQPWVSTAFVKTFEAEEWENISNSIYEDKDAFDKAFRDTKLVYKVLQNQDKIHRDINNIVNKV